MPDPSNSIPNSGNQNVQKLPTMAAATTSFGNAFRSGHHRRAHSEVNFRLPEDLDLASDPFDEIGSEDDLFCSYMDMEKLGSGGGDNGGGVAAESSEREKRERPLHRHSNSVDGSILLSESIEAKKAMAPDKLAELWTIDPKRANRYAFVWTVDLSELLVIFCLLNFK